MKTDEKKADRPIVPAAEIFTEETIKSIRSAIKENKGKEIFFQGMLNAEGIVHYVEALAFGSNSAVPIVGASARAGDVVIHNHPGGNIEPSEADINIAAEFSSLNVGSYIVDNKCENVRIIVKPIPPKKIIPLNHEKLIELLQPDGKISQIIDNYEYRGEQMQMLSSAIDSFNNNVVTIIEAGTGIGKSLAYLIPAIFWAKQNKERVIISTNTINLQEQILFKDIPLLKKALRINFNSVLIKGRSNYLCLRKLSLVSKSASHAMDAKYMDGLENVTKWSEKTEEGSKTDLHFMPAEDLWEPLQAEADTCPRLKCPNFEKCFFYKARRTAAQADIVIVNHHLLMADLAIRLETGNYSMPAVLPPSKRIIFDEAHNIEDVGTSYFSNQFTKIGIERLLSKLIAKRHERVGLLFIIDDIVNKSLLKNQSPELLEIQNMLFTKILNSCEDIALKIASNFSDMVLSFVQKFDIENERKESEEIKIRITKEILETPFFEDEIKAVLNNVTRDIIEFLAEIDELMKLIKKLQNKEKEKFWNVMIEIKGVINKIENVTAKINNFLKMDKDKCAWFEFTHSRKFNEPVLRFCSAPVYLGESMRKAVFDVNENVILTSATLSVKKNFEYFKKQAGLEVYETLSDISELKNRLKEGKEPKISDEAKHKKKEKKSNDDEYVDEIIDDDEEFDYEEKNEESNENRKVKYVTELQLDSPFDYRNNVLLGIPYDIPEPNSKEFSEKISEIILQSIEYSKGSALILFTSYGLMKIVYNKINHEITRLGYKCLLQGQTHRHNLLEAFKKDISSVLFATASFWEGIDVKGESLRLLILTRLPFRVPTEPILIARAEEIKKHGGDPFLEMDLPAAVIKFRQGFGRLIRSKTDRGAIIVLDRRLITKNYGSKFLKSLPDIEPLTAGIEEIMSELKQFFS